MTNKTKIFGFILIIVLIFSISLLSKNDQQDYFSSENQEINLEENKQENNFSNSETQIVLYYGIGCPACDVVKEFIEKNQIDSVVDFVKKEVYYNRNNANELSQRAAICKINQNQIEIPFLWDGEKCLVGVEDIINFFIIQSQSNEN